VIRLTAWLKRFWHFVVLGHRVVIRTPLCMVCGCGEFWDEA